MRITHKLMAATLAISATFSLSAQTLLSSDPADGSSMESFKGVSLTFDQSVTPKRSWSTDVKVNVGSTTGQKLSVAEWTMEKQGDNTVRIYPVNGGGTLTPLSFEGSKEYYLTIPKGEIKEYQSDIVLRYLGPEESNPLSIESYNPGNDSRLSTFEGVTISFNDNVSVRSSWSTKITLTTGSASGTKISVAEWELEKAGDNEVRIYPGNNSGFLAPVEMFEGTDYYLTIPGGEIKEWTEPIVIHYSGDTPLPPSHHIVSYQPEPESELAIFDGVTITFDNPVTTRSSWSTKIYLSSDSPSGNKVNVAEWELEKSGDNAVRIYPGNNSGYISPVTLDPGKDYYLTVPAGEIKEWKDNIVLHYIASLPKKEHQPMIYGTLLYSDSWEKGKARVGMYRIQADGEGGFQPVKLDNRLSAQMGGAKVGDKYFASFGNDIGITTLWVNTLWDTETWEPIEINPNGSQESMASCLTTDPTTNTVYGAFGDGTFGTIDPETKNRTIISTLTQDWNAIAASADGKLYVVNMGGDLLAVDKKTGATDLIGETGLTPHYMTSATIDPESGRMFYALNSDDKCGMYELSLIDGKAELLFEMPANEWFTGMYIAGPEAPDDAPDSVIGASVVWNGTGLDGTVKFMAPENTYGGAPLKTDLKYLIKEGSKVLAEGYCIPGREVSESITVPDEGMNTIVITVSNTTGSSPKTYLNVWAGPDTPDAPSSVNLSENTDGGYLISWSAVTTGVNGGWVDPEQVTYTVTRKPDNVVVAQDITETSFVDKTNNIAGVAFYYEVNANFMGNKSKATASPEMKSGLIIPPYSATFDDASEAASFSVINANSDGEKWEWNSGKKAMRLSASTSHPMDDWLVTPAIELEKGKVYTFSLDVSAQSATYPERYEVKLGSIPTAEGLGIKIIEPTTVSSISFITTEAKVKVDETGIYYFGIHGISDPDTYSLFVDNVAVSAGEVGEFRNLAIDIAAAPRYLEAGQRFIVNTRVQNLGTVAPDNAYLVAFSQEEELARTSISGLEPGTSEIIGIEVSTDRSFAHFTEITTRIEWAEDSVEEDNSSKPMTMIVHIPNLPEISGLKAEEADGMVKISWNAPDLSNVEGKRLTDNFEEFTPFEYDRAGEWIFYDADEAPNFGFANDKIAFPGMGDPASFFVFDVSYRNEYRQQSSLQAHSGDKYLASFSSMGGNETENWVISPRLSGLSQTVSFFAKSFDSNYGESFDVLASSKGMAEDDFTVVKSFANITNSWKEYSVELPANTLFFAVRHRTIDSYMMMIDDISLTPAGEVDNNLELVGYNIYCNGRKQNTDPITATELSHPVTDEADPKYAVEAIYNKGVSARSTEVAVTPSGILEISIDNETEFYDFTGRRILNPVPGSIVIVRQNGRTSKAIIR